MFRFLNPKRSKDKNLNIHWKLHDTYKEGVCCSRTVTRSQVCFNVIRNTPSDLELFADKGKHQPEGLPHLMVTLKGDYGAIPRTVVTRKLGEKLKIREELCRRVDEYKKLLS